MGIDGDRHREVQEIELADCLMPRSSKASGGACRRSSPPMQPNLNPIIDRRNTEILTRKENDLLCRVEGDAPMGQLMRRHWTPVCLIEEVSEPDGTPVKARVFGQNLVMFRDSDGGVGVLDEACPHRGASLALGRNEESGLRCLYHGWKMDAEGNVLEMASEPAASGMVDKVKHRAFASKEWGGMVWAWFGPADQVPAFTPPAWAPAAETRVSIAKVLLPCNWAQILEGAIDSAHSSSLWTAPAGSLRSPGKSH